MPRPSPSAVVRLIAKMETSVTDPSRNNSAKVPTMASPPTASGSNAATTLPNANTSSTMVSGTAIASAMARLRVTWWFTSLLMPAFPPASTVTGPRSPASRATRSLERVMIWASSPAMWPSTKACVPSVERRAAASEPEAEVSVAK